MSSIHRAFSRARTPGFSPAILLALVLAALPISGASATCHVCTPVEDLYGDITALHAPSFDRLKTEVGPAVAIMWSYAEAAETPTKLKIYRGQNIGDMTELYSCDDPGGCFDRFYRDADGVIEGEPFFYQIVYVTPDVGGIVTGQTTVTDMPPSNPRVAYYDTGDAIELSWDGSSESLYYRVVRENVVTRQRQTSFVDGSVTKFVDWNFSPDDAYEYTINGCRGVLSGNQCSPLTDGVRIGVGGGQVIHGLDEWLSRSRFRPDALLVDNSQGDKLVPSERLVFRDETTGASVSKLTNDPRRQHVDYTNVPVWNADGSRILFRSFGWHWGWRIMNADGSNLRDLDPAVGDYCGSDPSSCGFHPHWDFTDPDVLFYSNRAGEFGRLTPPSDSGPQIDLGEFWEAPDALLGDFLVAYHPDGSRVLGARVFDTHTRVFLVDTDSGIAVEDFDPLVPNEVLGVPGPPVTTPMAQLWFTKQSDYSFTFNPLGSADKQWIQYPPFDSVAVEMEVTYPGEAPEQVRGRHLGMSPDGTMMAFGRNGAHLTDITTGEGIVASSDADGHHSWQVDDDWFVASGQSSIWRIWVDRYQDGGEDVLDSHQTLIATPYTWLIYQGEYDAELHPESSPDGTKVAFNSPMTGYVDLYSVVMKLPDPPRDPSVSGSTLSWLAPHHRHEVASYNIWRTTTSGSDYQLFANVPASAPACTYTDQAPDDPCQYAVGSSAGYFYQVTAVEHSDLEGMPSAEASSAMAGNRRLWFEPHQGMLTRPLAPIYASESTGLYFLEAIADSADLDQAAVTLDVPAGAWRIWALTRGGSSGAKFYAYDGDTVAAPALLGEIDSEDVDWTWRLIDAATVVVSDAGSGAGQLTLAPSEIGVAVDQVLLTNDAGFTPVEIETLHAQAVVVPSVTGLQATPSRFHCDLSWSAASVSNFSHYNVYASSDPSETTWDQARLIASTVDTGVLDWGLQAGTLYSYRVSAVDRRGNESATLAARTCTTQTFNRYFSEIAPGPGGVLDPNSATGEWTFQFAPIPVAAAPAEFVAWMQLYFSDNLAVATVDVERTANGVTRYWDIQRDLNPIADGGGFAPNQPFWVSFPLQASNLHIFQPASLPAGSSQVRLTPTSGEPIYNMRVTGFVITNDLGYRPEGLQDYSFSDTLGVEAVAPSAACDDGVDNDSDGLFDYPADPGCDDAADADEQDPI